jgi:hypothetical protein
MMTDEKVLIFTTYITLANGKRLYASYYGLKAFAIWVKLNVAKKNCNFLSGVQATFLKASR